MDSYKCSSCDFSSKWQSNLKRHYKRIHEKIVTNSEKNVIDSEKNVIDFEKNVTELEKNVTDKTCAKCSKTFYNNSYVIKHMQKCKGKKDALECEYCNKVFKYRSNKSMHLKVCKVKIEADSKALVLASENKELSVQQNIDTQNNFNIETQNNIQTQNNIETQNNINIIVYSDDPDKMQFIKSESFAKTLQKLLKGKDEFAMIKDYNKEMMSVKENQCIKKTNLRSSTSQVHIGDDKWETRHDHQIFPHMVSNLANDFCTMLLSQQDVKRYKLLEKVLDCVVDNGYVNDTDDKQKEMFLKFNNLVMDLKLVVYDMTKI